MLKIMRQHAKSPIIKIILYAVVLSFIATIFLIWGRGKGGIEENPYVVATIGDTEISSQEFLRAFRIQLNQQEASLSQGANNKLLKQLIGNQTLSILINQQLMLSEAHKRGLKVSPQEIMDHIITNYPVFQENGKFIGLEQYREILQANRISEAEFENSLRDELLIQKFQMLILSNAFVYPDEIWKKYKEENEKVKIDYILVRKDAFTEEVKAAPEELQSYFNENKQQYLAPEKRKIEYVLIDETSLREKIEATKEEIEQYYSQHKNLFLVPEERRASHILIKLAEGASQEIAEQAEIKAQEIFEKAMAGEDFSQLAKEYSEDEATAIEGGDLGYFPRGRLVPEFDSKAFAMSISEISDPIKSQFGFHIIKLIDIRNPYYKDVNDIEVQTRIKKELADVKSQQEIDNLSKKIAELSKDKKSLAEAAETYSLEVKESDFFSQEDEIAEIANSFSIVEEAFQLKVGKISSPIKLSNGYAVIKLVEKKDSYMPELDEVKERVEDDFKREGSSRIAQQKINSLKEKLTTSDQMEQIAEENQLEVNSTNLFSQDEYLPQLGRSSLIFREAFALGSNQISKVITLDNGYYLFRIAEKNEAKRSEFLEKKDELEKQLLYQKQMSLLTETISNLRETSKIYINAELFDRLIS